MLGYDDDPLGGETVRERLSRLGFPSSYNRALANIWEVARAGDVERLSVLVSSSPELLDAVDESNSTPLFYASLCGHAQCVQLLLERGAACEEATFEGERAVYGALNDDIRELLADWRAATRTSGGPLSRHLFFLFDNRSARAKSDIELIVAVDGTRIALHRAVLSARCHLLAEKLAGRWAERDEVVLTDARLDGPCLRAVLRYLYTERFVLPRSRLGTAIAIARSLRLQSLTSRLSAELESAHQKGDMVSFVLSTSLQGRAGEAPAAGALEGARGDSLRNDLWRLLLATVVPAGVKWADQIRAASSCDLSASSYPIVHDVEFACGSGAERTVFKCHSAIIAGRSPFIEALLGFDGAPPPHRLAPRAVALADPPVSALATLFSWFYADAVPAPESPLAALEAIDAAAHFLVRDGLPAALAAHAARLLGTGSVATVTEALPQLWRAGELLGNIRLSEACASAAAHQNMLPHIIASEEFRALVADDARGITRREEFDSVPVLDALKGAIRRRRSDGASEDADSDLSRVDELAAELGLKTRR
jgi:hypothetical protein